MKTERLYKIDTNKKVRVWWMEFDEEKYRTCTGVDGGAVVESGWKYPEAKNIGRANATTVAEQVLSEVESHLKKRIEISGYHKSIEEAREKGAPFFLPMLANKFDPKKDTFPMASQPKLDGGRCVTSANFQTTRNGKAYVSVPHIKESLQGFFEKFPDAVLDGELYSHDLHDNFDKIMSLIRKTKNVTSEDQAESKKYVQFWVYDVYLDGVETFEERSAFLQEHLVGYEHIVVVPTIVINSEEEADEQLGVYLEQGFEGQMLRKLDSLYENRRSDGLKKHKSFDDDEFEILDVIEGTGNWAGVAKALMIRISPTEVQESGMRGSMDKAKEILENKDDYIGTQATIRFQGKTSKGKLRFPVATYFWKSKRDV